MHTQRFMFHLRYMKTHARTNAHTQRRALKCVCVPLYVNAYRFTVAHIFVNVIFMPIKYLSFFSESEYKIMAFFSHHVILHFEFILLCC